MYRYSVDHAVTYTSEDFVLFRESPFACWMERLTLENPDHGIPPDVGSVPPCENMERQDEMADTLRAEDKDVVLIDWEAPESVRRGTTLDAMRKGADFIVNGQLALGPLSGVANLLVRTSGYSELGDYVYIPCETQTRTTAHSAFRLCFLADLLHSLQGQLPPQMLVIRGGDDLVPLPTEDHIYHYRAVKQRFMESMRGFRKHRMPDPAESAHFGRWSDCAHEVLKQRQLRAEEPGLGGESGAGAYVVEPLRKAIGAALRDEPRACDPDHSGVASDTVAGAGNSAAGEISGVSQPGGATLTLAEQARILKPGTYKPGPGHYRLGPPRVSSPGKPEQGVATAASPEAVPGPAAAGTGGPPVEDKPRHNRRASDAALQNLEFIGRERQSAGPEAAPAIELAPGASTAPAPSLRDPHTLANTRVGPGAEMRPLDYLPDRPVSKDSGDETRPAASSAIGASMPPPGDDREAPPAPLSSIDMDDTYPASPPSRLTTSGATVAPEVPLDAVQVSHDFGQAAREKREVPREAAANETKKDYGERAGDGAGFSNSLITSEDYPS